MNRFIRTIVGVVAGILAGCGAFEPGEEELGRPAATVRVVKVESTVLQPSVKLTGVLTPIPENTAVVSSQIAGQIKHIVVHESQRVHAGDVISMLDSRVHEAELAIALAARDEARANFAMVKRGPMPEEIAAARQEARSAAAASEAQRAKVKALEPLHERGEISGIQFEQAQSSSAQAEALGQAALQRLKLLESGTRPEIIEQASAAVAGAEADVASRELAVALCSITSPIDGVIAELPVRQGMFIDQPTVLARVVNDSALFARIRVPSRVRTEIREGAVAVVTVGEGVLREYSATVARMGSEADPQTGDVDIFLTVQNEDGFLQGGLSCTVNILLPEIPDAVVVPESALADRAGTAVVTVIRDDKAYETEVARGVQQGDRVQITSGLSAGDLVATSGGYGLPDACPVTVVNDSPHVSK